MTLEDALARLRAAKPLLDRYGVQRVGVFGSTARGEAGPDSDVDVLVEYGPATLPGFGFFRLERDLAALFGRPVDLVTQDGLHELIQARVMDEAVFA
ncbi:nucleotidyltransferase family protein [Caulobacter sp. DWR2-3-1b2]|uniref:nucleotidyltransferase family protein n=1 Tax=unclassified Caulobacter TaxID=2648921 RepID=UPI00198805E8|nr:nucleotidyltransferase family protein [Caulobacter sp.]